MRSGRQAEDSSLRIWPCRQCGGWGQLSAGIELVYLDTRPVVYATSDRCRDVHRLVSPLVHLLWPIDYQHAGLITEPFADRVCVVTPEFSELVGFVVDLMVHDFH
jgi:hypothetical protein